MNINMLLDLLMVKQKTESCDAISDFKQLINSPDLSKHVKNIINDEILPKAKKIIDNKSSFIDVEVGMNSVIIKKDDRIIFEKESEWDRYFGRLIYENLKKYSKDENIIYSFRTIGNLEDEIFEEIYEEFDDIKERIMKEVIVCKINKDNVLEENNKFTNNFYKCLIKDEENFYFVYFKIKRGSDKYTNNPVLYYLINRIQDEKVDEKNTENVYENNCIDATSFSWVDVIKDVLKKTLENKNIDSFFDVNFVRQESNDFFQCMDLIKSDKSFDDILRSYFENSSEDKANKFLFTLKHFYLKNLESYRISYSDNEKAKKEFKIALYLKSFLPVEYKDMVVEDPILSSLQSFFIYQLQNNRDFIMKYQKDFMENMNWRIYVFLKHLFETLEEKIFEIIRLYNKKHFEESNFFNNSKKVDEPIQKESSK